MSLNHRNDSMAHIDYAGQAKEAKKQQSVISHPVTIGLLSQPQACVVSLLANFNFRNFCQFFDFRISKFCVSKNRIAFFNHAGYAGVHAGTITPPHIHLFIPLYWIIVCESCLTFHTIPITTPSTSQRGTAINCPNAWRVDNHAWRSLEHTLTAWLPPDLINKSVRMQTKSWKLAWATRYLFCTFAGRGNQIQ